MKIFLSIFSDEHLVIYIGITSHHYSYYKMCGMKTLLKLLVTFIYNSRTLRNLYKFDLLAYFSHIPQERSVQHTHFCALINWFYIAMAGIQYSHQLEHSVCMLIFPVNTHVLVFRLCVLIHVHDFSTVMKH